MIFEFPLDYLDFIMIYAFLFVCDVVLVRLFVIDPYSICLLGLAGDLKKAMKDGKPIIIEVCLLL